MQQRKDEILAKKAKLAELKRQRELRKETMAGRASMGGSPDASPLDAQASHLLTTYSYSNQHLREPTRSVTSIAS
jgi:hypothetical protein